MGSAHEKKVVGRAKMVHVAVSKEKGKKIKLPDNLKMLLRRGNTL